jgi:hypothetical protein
MAGTSTYSYKCPRCNEEFLSLIVTIRTSRSRSINRLGRSYSVRYYNADGTENLLTFLTDKDTKVELKSKDKGVFTYTGQTLKTIQNLTIGTVSDALVYTRNKRSGYIPLMLFAFVCIGLGFVAFASPSQNKAPAKISTVNNSIQKTQPSARSTTVPATTGLPISYGDYERVIQHELGVSQVASIISVRIADGRNKGGERGLILTYSTDKTTQQGYNDEWIAILTSLGKIIKANGIDLDSVALISGASGGDIATGILTAQIKDVLAFTDGKLSRVQLLNRAQFVPFGSTPIPATKHS